MNLLYPDHGTSISKIHIFFSIVIAIIGFFSIFKFSGVLLATGEQSNMSNADIIYSIQTNSSVIDFDRGFLIRIMPVKGYTFMKSTLVNIPTNLTEGSRVTVSIVENSGNIKKLLLSRVKNHKISFYTKQAGTFQIMKIDTK